MQDKLKHRLVGLFVIVLSAGILFPLFFDGEGYRERHLQTAIPPMPALPEVVSITPKTQPLPDTSAVAPPEQPAPDLPKSETLVKKVEPLQPVISTAEEKPVLDKEGVPVAWTLQLATFSDEDNAKELRNTLIDAGHKVYTRKNGDLVKVYIGPDFQRTNLEQLRQRLKKEFNLEGIIVRFSTR